MKMKSLLLNSDICNMNKTSDEEATENINMCLTDETYARNV